MKKIVLSVLVAGSLLATSCKEAKKGATDLKDVTVETAGSAVDATTDAANAVVDGAKNAAGTVVDGAKDAANAVVSEAKEGLTSAIEGVTIPAFSNEAVSKNLLEYAQYAKNYVDANGNVAKISAMASKGASILKQGKELASKLDASELTKYKSVLSKIQAKMAPAKL